ncbi:hypothetical protein SAMN05421505_11937 [Sinosporangium album]|uniref:Uncharacterized protein n=1 Tax=Sinosporangium album TaxID=504805 RepID=A0A1G8DXT5_9ACTN|nr:hypothetical protein SAMN05421505_11937 [Sinosporangium album]
MGHKVCPGLQCRMERCHREAGTPPVAGRPDYLREYDGERNDLGLFGAGVKRFDYARESAGRRGCPGTFPGRPGDVPGDAASQMASQMASQVVSRVASQARAVRRGGARGALPAGREKPVPQSR